MYFLRLENGLGPNPELCGYFCIKKSYLHEFFGVDPSDRNLSKFDFKFQTAYKVAVTYRYDLKIIFFEKFRIFYDKTVLCVYREKCFPDE